MCVSTLSGHNEARHAVGDAGTGCQEGDAHDDVGDAQREANDGDLRHSSHSQNRPYWTLLDPTGRTERGGASPLLTIQTMT